MPRTAVPGVAVPVAGVVAGLAVPLLVPVAPFVLSATPGARSGLLPAAPGLAAGGVPTPARDVFTVPRDVFGALVLAGLRRALGSLRRALGGLRCFLGLGRFRLSGILGPRRFPGSCRLGPCPRLVGAGVPQALARVGAAGCAVELTRRPGKFLAQGTHCLPDVLGDLAGDVADRRGDLFLKLGEVVQSGVQFFPALVCDPVHLPAIGFVVRDEALFLEPGEPRVDRPG
jgi:hypothetical protein